MDEREPTQPADSWLPELRDEKFARGVDGRLFLAHDSNDVMRQQAGDLLLAPEQVEGWQALLEERRERLAGLGATYVVLIAPEAHSVYPESLPADVHWSPVRPVTQLLAKLEQASAPVPVLYPLAELVEERDGEDLYSRTDSHWSERGALVAYERVIDEIERAGIAVKRLRREQVKFTAVERPGDLGVKLDPPEQSPMLYAKMRGFQARLLTDNRVRGHGRLMTLASDAAPDTRCLLFGDSAAYMVLPFMAESFGRLTFAFSPTLDLGLVEDESPRVVVSVITERYLIELPRDDEGRPVREVAGEKVEKGDVRPPLRRWDVRRSSSP